MSTPTFIFKYYINTSWTIDHHISTRTDLIGQGAYGTVYKGTQRSTNRTVAIKRIPYADTTPEGGVPCNVIREISLLRELTHNNVVQLLDVVQATPGGLYLVFEYVQHDLKTFMDQRQTSDDIRERVGLPRQMVRSFMQQILNGVGYCHTHRVLHRDLKPHNVSGFRRCRGAIVN
jgi:serine/threonine protein kinase